MCVLFEKIEKLFQNEKLQSEHMPVFCRMFLHLTQALSYVASNNSDLTFSICPSQNCSTITDSTQTNLPEKKTEFEKREFQIRNELKEKQRS